MVWFAGRQELFVGVSELGLRVVARRLRNGWQPLRPGQEGGGEVTKRTPTWMMSSSETYSALDIVDLDALPAPQRQGSGERARASHCWEGRGKRLGTTDAAATKAAR